MTIARGSCKECYKRLWQHVSEGIKTQDLPKSSEHKHRIEQNQRALIKQRDKEGKTWESRWFKTEGEEWTFKFDWSDEESLRKVLFASPQAPDYALFWIDSVKKEEDGSDDDPNFEDAPQSL